MDSKKMLFEVSTGDVGESHVRCYIWCRSTDELWQLFRDRHPDRDASKAQARFMFSEDAEPFCTAATDHGWPEEESYAAPTE